MDIGVAILRDKLIQYVGEKITKNEIGFWSYSAYLHLLKGEYFEIDKLVIFHFIRTLSTIHTTPNNITDDYPCSEDEVKKILGVLNGEKSLSYTFNTMISKQAYESYDDIYKSKLQLFSKIENYILEYLNNNSLDLSKMRELIAYSRQCTCEINTLTDLLEAHLINILSENIDHEYEEFFAKTSCIHVEKEIDKNDFAHSILKLLICIMSDMYFRVCVQYRKGYPIISLIL